jgi:hypothetical protein
VLILINGNYLQALEKISASNNWITLVLLFLFLCVFLLKTIDAYKLKGAVFSVFKVSFIEREAEKKTDFFDVFQILIFTFSSIVISLLVFDFKAYKLGVNTNNFASFFTVFLSVSTFFLIKKALEFLLSHLFMVRKEVKFFIISKAYYINAISFLLYIAVILNQFTGLKQLYLYYFAAFLFLLQFVFHAVNNKKLIFKKLFYFILYICAFEIAPLFILFKLMF